MKNKRRRNARRTSSISRSTYETLEAKNLLASIYHNLDNGILYIGGDSASNVGQVNVVNGDVVAQVDGISFSAANSTVSDIVFIGYAGDDTFTNLSSRSATMYGHLGADTLNGGSGDDNLIGGPGNDVIKGNDGDDRVVGADGNDNLEGGAGDDAMFGTAGVNMIFGGEGDDVIYGSPDVDEIHGDQGADKIYALGGDDILYTGLGGVEGGAFEQGDLAMGHDGDDQFFGEGGLDIFYGGNGNDEMVGGIGENRMHGQDGDDTITGGPKADYVTGANGNDTFEGRGGLDFYNVGNGSDTIIYSINYNPSEVRVTNVGGQVETRIQNELVSGASWIQFGDRTISANQASYDLQDEVHFSRLNGHRTANSEVFLSKPSDLADYARNWSMEMARLDRLVHSSQGDQQGLLTGTRTNVGENVSVVTDTGQTEIEIANYFFETWRDSSIHNGNMLSSDFLEVGIGIVNSGGKWWATQIFVG